MIMARAVVAALAVTLSAATTRSKMAAMKLQASEGDGDEDALSPV